MSILGVGLAIVAAAGLAMQALTIRMATRNDGRSGDVLLVVMIVNAVVLVPLVLVFDPNPVLTPRAIMAFAGAGIAGTMLGRAFFYAGIERVGASRAEPIKASMPIHATILAIIILGERVTIVRFFGILLIVAGVAFISMEGRSADRIRGVNTPLQWLALPFIGAFFFGLEPIFASIGLLEGTSILAGLVIKTLTGLSCYSIYLMLRGQFPGRQAFSTPDRHWYFLAGVSSTTFLLAYYAGLSVADVSIVVPIMQTSPLIVIVISAIYLQKLEVVTPRLILSALTIVAGGVAITIFN